MQFRRTVKKEIVVANYLVLSPGIGFEVQVLNLEPKQVVRGFACCFNNSDGD